MHLRPRVGFYWRAVIRYHICPDDDLLFRSPSFLVRRLCSLTCGSTGSHTGLQDSVHIIILVDFLGLIIYGMNSHYNLNYLLALLVYSLIFYVDLIYLQCIVI